MMMMNDDDEEVDDDDDDGHGDDDDHDVKSVSVVGTDVNVCLELINVLYFEASTETTKLRTFPDATQHAATRAVGCSPH